MVIGAGLKMYLGHRQTLEWLTGVAKLVDRHPGCRRNAVELFVLPAFPSLAQAVALLSPSGVRVGAQDLFWEDRGPFTGEVSGVELAELGCTLVEVGHAERRTLFGETDDVVSRKTAAAFRNGLMPVLCVGESDPQEPDLAARECVRQLAACLEHSRVAESVGPVLLAYEPQWAIGATAPADPAYIRTVCGGLRAALEKDNALNGSRVVYGGSAGAGMLGRLGGAVDGLFLGRASHDLVVLEAVLDEADDASRSLGA